MTKGVVLIACNNSEIDYIKQANFLAMRVRKYMHLPTTVITDNVEYLQEKYPNHYFDQIVEIPQNKQFGYKKYFDGVFSKKQLEFKNTDRSSVYDLSPYNETLVLDTDFVVSNNLLCRCFNQSKDFLIYKNAYDFAGWRDPNEFKFISEIGPDFYWATCVFFRKTEENKIFFDLVSHIKQNYSHYRNLYKLNTNVFRNDHAFSIAIHIMNGFTENNFAGKMPGTMYYITDRDLLLELTHDNFLLLVQKQNDSNEYVPLRVKGSNIHVMNKYSLNRVIDNA
jgi:hypothetical protein